MKELEKILEEIEKGTHTFKLFGRDVDFVAIDWVRDIIRNHMNDGWIPVEERLPEEWINPITNDFYEYQVTAKFGECVDIRHYKFGRGHWWHGPAIVDKYVIAWQPLQEPYNPRKDI